MCHSNEHWTFILNVHSRSELVSLSGNHFLEFWILCPSGHKSSSITTISKGNGVHSNCWSNGISSVRLNVQVLINLFYKVLQISGSSFRFQRLFYMGKGTLVIDLMILIDLCLNIFGETFDFSTERRAFSFMISTI